MSKLIHFLDEPPAPFCPQTVHAVAGLVPPSPPATMGPTGGSASAPQPLHSPHVRTEQLMSGNSAPNSPMAMLNIGSSHENEVGDSPLRSGRSPPRSTPLDVNPLQVQFTSSRFAK